MHISIIRGVACLGAAVRRQVGRDGRSISKDFLNSESVGFSLFGMEDESVAYIRDSLSAMCSKSSARRGCRDAGE